MLTRIGALCIILFWAVMMSWLVWEDLWPAWTAQDPPKTVLSGLPTQGKAYSQVGIFDHRDQRIGSAWTTYTRLLQATLRNDCIWIARFPVLPPTRVEVDSSFDASGLLDEIEIHVYGYDIAVEIKGERFPREFVFEVKVGYQTFRTFKIPHTQAGAFGDMFRPFAALPDLRVGQAWRMQVLNPAAVVSGFGETFAPLLVRVVGTETVVRNGGPVECFVVEAGGARALVGPDGVVYEQSVELPVGGTIVIRDEPYDAETLRRVRSMSLSGADGGES